jgi:predicted HicB family RNase H-like nuclease
MTTKASSVTDKYTYRVTWSEEDGEHVGLCAEFPSLSWLEATSEAALRGIIKLVRETLGDMKKRGEEIPQPIATHNYSGAFKVRIPAALHRRLAIEAAESHVSLNRLVSMKLATTGDVGAAGSRARRGASPKPDSGVRRKSA